MSSPSLKAPVKASVGSSAGKKHVCESFEKWKRRVWMNKGRHKRMEWIWAYIEAQKSFFLCRCRFPFFCGLAVAVEIHRPRCGRAGKRCFGWRALGGGGKAMECDVCGAD